MNYKITPKSLILSILQEAKNNTMPIKSLIDVGEIFGFPGNSIRVTVVRLVREELVESDERGLYRYSATRNPLLTFVNSWRYGEKRIKPWQGDWIAGWLPKITPWQIKKGKKALSILGFREGLTGLWIRPNNINLKIDALHLIMEQLGGHPDTELFIANQFNAKLTEQWAQFLWPIDKIVQSHNKIFKKLEKSALQLSKMPIDDALRESYIIGSQAIQSLNTDPLLPEDIVSNKSRVILTKAMLSYDNQGREIWAKKCNGLYLDKTPTHLQLFPEFNEDLQGFIIK